MKIESEQPLTRSWRKLVAKSVMAESGKQRDDHTVTWKKGGRDFSRGAAERGRKDE
jgi:hypothetical protein